METKIKYLLIAIFVAVGLTAAVYGETVTFETHQGYPATGAANKSIIGVDGWTSDTNSTTAFIVDGGPTRPPTAGPASQVGRINEQASYYRVFSEPNDLKVGTVSFIVYAGNAGNDNICFWVILKDSTPNGSDDIALQLRFAKDDTQINATGYWQLVNGTGGVVATSPDIAEITHSTWYHVEIDYDLDDTTGGSNGTYDFTLTNLDLARPEIVWSKTEVAIAEAVSEVDYLHLGPSAVGGTKTMIDDITMAMRGLPVVGEENDTTWEVILTDYLSAEHLTGGGDNSGEHRIVSSTVDVRAYSSINAAVSNIGSAKKTLLIPDTQTLTGNLTVPSNIAMRVLNSGKIDTAGYTLTINGPVEAALYQVFDSNGSVTFGAGANKQILAHWFVGSGISASNVDLNGTEILMAKDPNIVDYFDPNQQGSFAWCLACTGVKGVRIPGSDTDYNCSTELKTFDIDGLYIIGPGTNDAQTGGRFSWQGASGATMWEIAGCSDMYLTRLEMDGEDTADIGIIFRGRNWDGGHRAINCNIENLFVNNCNEYCVQIGDPNAQQFSESTFRNLRVGGGGSAGLRILGGNTQDISFVGGYSSGSPVGVRYDDGGALFMNFTTTSNSTVDYDLSTPQGGIHIIKGYSEQSGLFLRTNTNTSVTANRPLIIESTVCFTSDGSGRSIYHRNSENLIMIGNLMSGNYESTGASGDSGPACIVDIGNTWGSSPVIADNQVQFIVDTDKIQFKGLRLPVQAVTDSTYSISYGTCSGTVYTNEGNTDPATITLPVAVEGLTFTFIRVASETLRIDPSGTESIRGGGAGDYLSLDSDGASVILQVVSDNGTWEIVTERGTTSFQ